MKQCITETATGKWGENHFLHNRLRLQKKNAVHKPARRYTGFIAF